MAVSGDKKDTETVVTLASAKPVVGDASALCSWCVDAPGDGSGEHGVNVVK